MNLKSVSLLAFCAAALVGCGNSSGDTATVEDKKNLDNLIQHGIGTGTKAPAPDKGAGVPVSGKVDPP